MSFLLSCQSLTKAFGPRPLFRDITLGITEGERLGLIGPNGTGKSTFLKILAGLETPDEGIVSGRRGLRIGYVPQEDTFAEGTRIMSVLWAALEDSPLDGHEKERVIARTVAKFGFTDPEQETTLLSGGWRKRLAIAREWIRDPDLLLLDEPTNHLDMEGILWLEKELHAASFALIAITHDRYFLENVTNRIVEMNRAYAEGYLSISAPYSQFLIEKEAYLSGQAHRQVALQSKARREVEWLSRNPQARTTKAQYRIDEAGRLLDELSEVRFRNAQNQTAAIDFTASGRKTRELVVVKNLTKKVGERTLFSHLNLTLAPGTRLGLLGPNGSGKTTLLRLVTGQQEPEHGSITRADGLRIVYFDQNRAPLDRAVSLRNALSPNGETIQYRGSSQHVAGWAKRFQFLPDQLDMPLSRLSGGEQARVLIAQLMLQPADLLILDEPTNDLDIATLEVLEESLLEFPGALVLVTHDRYLLDRVSTELLALDGHGGSQFLADYAQWERWQAQQKRVPVSAVSSAPKTPPALTNAERRELGKMEETIMAAEAEVERLQARLAEPKVATDTVRLQEGWQAVQAAQQKVAALYTRWEELETKRSG